MIVVDTNVLAYLWIPGEMTHHAEKALRIDPVWVAPFLWRSEFRSVLTGCIRRGHMTMETALRAIEGAESLLKGQEYTVPADKVVKRVAQSACSAYDCEFVALADDLGVPLVTADDLVLREFPAIAIALRDFAGRRAS